MKKSVKIISIVVCVAILAAAVVGVASRAVRVEDGRRIRKAFNEYAERVVRLRASGEFEDSDDDPALSDWFTAPEGFLPVKDGTVYKSVINPYDTPEEWDLLEDAVEMREVSQLPETARNATTAELVLYCMNYNLFIDFMLFDTMQDGMENIRSDYNGIRELMTRPDAAESLIRLYKLYDLDEQKARDSVGCIRLCYLEAMLCMPEILNSLTAKQAKELAAACTQKISKIVNDENSPYSVSTTMYLAAVSQYAASEEFAEIVNASSGAKRYIEEGILVPDEISDDTLGRIVSYFQEL